jgi:hypothetical protein
MTQNFYQVELTSEEISTILYYIESGVQGVNEEVIEPEVYTIFQKLENVPVA